MERRARLGEFRPAGRARRRLAPGTSAVRFLGELIGGQIGLATPLVFVFCVAGVVAARGGRGATRDPAWTLLAALTLPPVLLFVQHALGDRVQGNWPAIIYPAAAIAAGGSAGAVWQRLCAPGRGAGLRDHAAGLSAGEPSALLPLPVAPRPDRAAAGRLGRPGGRGRRGPAGGRRRVRRGRPVRRRRRTGARAAGGRRGGRRRGPLGHVRPAARRHRRPDRHPGAQRAPWPAGRSTPPGRARRRSAGSRGVADAERSRLFRSTAWSRATGAAAVRSATRPEPSYRRPVGGQQQERRTAALLRHSGFSASSAASASGSSSRTRRSPASSSPFT